MIVAMVTLESAQEEIDKLTEALFIAKSHFQALGGDTDDEIEEKIKELTEHNNR